MDWTEWSNGLKCCVVLDDSSRKILAGIECENATAEASIKLVKQVLEEYGHIRRIREIITDHGTQFYANKRDKKGNAEHSFEQYLESEGVKHILCRITTTLNPTVRLNDGSKNTRNTGKISLHSKTSYAGITTDPTEAMTFKLPNKYSGKEHKHTYSEDSSNGQKNNNKAQYLPDTTTEPEM